MKILAIRGVLDSSTGPKFEKSLIGLVREHNEPIGLDCSGLKYMTSAGVAAFLRVHQRIQERKGRIAIIRPSPEVSMMLDFLGISRYVPVFDSEEAMRHSMPEQESFSVTERMVAGSDAPPSAGLSAAAAESHGATSAATARSAMERPEVRGGILPPQGSPGATEGSFEMGQSFGRLSETLDGLTRNLKSLGKTMEDLQRTEHSLKEEFELERKSRKSHSAANHGDRSFSFSEDQEKATGENTESRAAAAGFSERGTAGGTTGTANSTNAQTGVTSPADRARVSATMSGQSAAARSRKSRSESSLNRVLVCEQCGSKLRIYRAGRHLCPSCKIEFEVETDGSTSYYEKLATS